MKTEASNNSLFHFLSQQERTHSYITLHRLHRCLTHTCHEVAFKPSTAGLQVAYLPQQPRGGVRRQDGRGHVLADSVQLLDLPFPHLQQPLPSPIHALASHPLALQAEGEARLLLLAPESTTDEHS